MASPPSHLSPAPQAITGSPHTQSLPENSGERPQLQARSSSVTAVIPNDGDDVPSKDDVANATEQSTRMQRIRYDLLLLVCVVFMVVWPWAVFAFIKGKNGVQMYGRLADIYHEYPHEVAIIVTQLGTANRLAATFLLGKVVVRFGQELIASAHRERVTVFGVSALMAFRHMSLVWGWGQSRQLAKGKGRFFVVALLLLCLAALSLIPSGTAGLITPGEFNKTAELRGAELDFFSEDTSCLAWLEENRVRNNCDWTSFGGTQYTTCLGENQMFDVLDSGRANMLSAIGIKNGTSSLNQLGAEGGIRFLGSVKGILPNGPDGVPAFNSLKPSLNPFENPSIRRDMVSYNYTLIQQGLESTVSCIYDTSSPIRHHAVEDVAPRIIASSGSCDPTAGLEDVLENVGEYPTLNVNNTLTYWACKQRPLPGTLDPTYFIYLRGRVNYATSIGNITCKVSPMRSQIYSVDYLSLRNHFVTKPATNPDPQSSQRATFSRYIEWGLVGLGNLIWEGQSWTANLVAEAVFSFGAKSLNLSTFEPNPKYLELYEAMLQGVLEYEATYSRLVYSLGPDPPQTCLRNITGSVSYSVRGWYISKSATQAGLLLPMTLINLASLSLLVACFVIGKFEYRYEFDATDNISLLSALVEGSRRGTDGTVEWENKVKYIPVHS
ncbi:hypothetical protein EST38_g9143 [Candolleomyces aberdarensis]|uniref:Transmembrane protein n=1 Tax=Candolleomyces aberdarensis TaxID=2316362 RepID=A0A4Q2DCF9_9AGAR|nr:hypothetical protein EST38_g9143 [Candolleomyces aberdarensis]